MKQHHVKPQSQFYLLANTNRDSVLVKNPHLAYWLIADRRGAGAICVGIW
jgi:hypothetical protein